MVRSSSNLPLNAKDVEFIENLDYPMKRHNSIENFKNDVSYYKFYAPNGFITHICFGNIKRISSRFRDFSPSFKNLTHLEYLRFQGTEFESYKSFPNSFPNLKSLIIIGDTFKNFQSSPLSLPQLKYLSIGNNNLQNFDFLPTDLSKLHEINWTMAPNPTKNVALISKIMTYPNLKRLTITHCDFFSLPHHLTCYNSLEYLSLASNKLNSLEFLPKSLPNLKFLSIRNNFFKNFKTFPTNLPKLIRLDVQHNPIDSLHGLSRPILSHLIELNIQNGISDINWEFFPLNVKLRLPARVWMWIESQDIKSILDYYKYSISDLCRQVIIQKKASLIEKERLQYEISHKDLHYLEKNLPPNSPILEGLQNRFNISTIFSHRDTILL